MTSRRRDVLAGGLCLLAGLAAAVEAQRYPVGTLREIGPGFMPLVFGVMLVVAGLLIAATAFTGTTEPEAEDVALPPEWLGWGCIVAGVALFLVLVRPAGLVVAGFLSILVWALGDRQTTWRGAVALAFCLSAFGSLLFGVLLGINLPLWPSMFGP